MVKRRTRTYRFSNEIDEFGIVRPGPHSWINEVVESIEVDKLNVYDPKDSEALSCILNEKGEELIESRLSLEVPVREWLPVGCQSVRWFTSTETIQAMNEKTLAFYKHNAMTVLCPCDRIVSTVQGIAAFVGEIAINKEEWAFEEDKFKCVLAHELVHVFDLLKLLVPAFLDWRAFWRSVLNEGLRCEDAARRYHDTSVFVDNYGEDNERLSILHYWPSQANKWFEAFRETKGR